MPVTRISFTGETRDDRTRVERHPPPKYSRLTRLHEFVSYVIIKPQDRLLNPNQACLCGKQKSIKEQWCQACWGKLAGSMEQARFYAVRKRLTEVIQECNEKIKL